MPSVQRMGDVNTGGYAIIDIPQSTVFANGILVAVENSITDQPGVTLSQSGSNVFINGRRVIVTGDVDDTGDVRIGGSNTVNIG